MIAETVRAAELAAYERASARLLSLIRGERSGSRTPLARRRRAEARLARSRALLHALGAPHRAYPVVHVTGTSGKGSTCTMIAAILTAAGFRVGLRTSPYLQVATEKLQIGSLLIDASSFECLTEQVLGRAAVLFPSEVPGNRFSYAEAWTGLAFSWFAEQNVDVAVVEVGAGGRFDTTNVVEPAVSVITSVGLDHVVSLGPTIADIAWHKAGIIKPGAPAVIGDVPTEALAIIRDAAQSAGVELVRAVDASVPLGAAQAMPGRFQQANARCTIAAIEALRRRGFTIPDAAILAGLASARVPARLERMPGPNLPAVWLDGAHNADKIDALAGETDQLRADGVLPVLVLGVLGTKDASAIVERIAPSASAIVATEPSVHGKRSLKARELARVIRDSSFTGELHVEPDPPSALDRADTLARSRGADVLVTGSLYLAGQVRRQWFPDAEIIVQRTPWPKI